MRIGLKWLTETPRTCEANLLDRSDRRMLLETAFPIPCGAAIEIRLKEGLVLGEVVQWTQRGESYEIRVVADQVLAAPWDRGFTWRDAAPDSTFEDLLRLAARLEKVATASTERSHP